MGILAVGCPIILRFKRIVQKQNKYLFNLNCPFVLTCFLRQYSMSKFFFRPFAVLYKWTYGCHGFDSVS